MRDVARRAKRLCVLLPSIAACSGGAFMQLFVGALAALVAGVRVEATRSVSGLDGGAAVAFPAGQLLRSGCVREQLYSLQGARCLGCPSRLESDINIYYL